MIGTIVKREFLGDLFSFRFAVGLILCLVLAVSSARVLTVDYEERLGKYNEAVRAHREEQVGAKVYSQLRIVVDRRPEMLSVFCEGAEKRVGNTLTISYDQAPVTWERWETHAIGQYGSGRSDPHTARMFLGVAPLRSMFRSVDFAVIVQVILSILALLLACDAISGEREGGTLFMTLSNPVSKAKVLLGKYLAHMGCLTLVTVVGFLAALIVVELSPMVALTGGDWVRLILVLFLSLLYLSVFLMLGMLVSVRASRTATAFIVLFFVWILVVMVIPNMAGYVAERVHEVEPQQNVQARAAALESEFWEQMEAYARAHPEPEGVRSRSGGWYSGWIPFQFLSLGLNKAAATWIGEGMRFGVPLRIRYADEAWRIYQAYYKALERQASLARNIGHLSPSSLYYDAVSHIAGTNIGRYMAMLSRAVSYRQDFVNYMRGKEILLSVSFFSPIAEDELDRPDGWKKYETWDEVPPLNLSDVPRPNLGEDSLTGAIEKTLPDMGLLALLNVLLFMAAYALFIKKT